MADEEDPAPLDVASFVPEAYKGDDGAYDTAKFRADYDALSSFKSQADERTAAMPKDASGYGWALPEDHVFPEGFDPELMKTKDEAGNEVAFDAAGMLNADDPDLPVLQSIMHKHGANPEIMRELASVFVNRELRGVMQAQEFAAREKAALGTAQQQQARIGDLTRAVTSRLPKAQADALLNSLTTADAVRGMEALIRTAATTIPAAPAAKDLSAMSIDDRIKLGLQQRERKSA